MTLFEEDCRCKMIQRYGIDGFCMNCAISKQRVKEAVEKQSRNLKGNLTLINPKSLLKELGLEE